MLLVLESMSSSWSARAQAVTVLISQGENEKLPPSAGEVALQVGSPANAKHAIDLDW